MILISINIDGSTLPNRYNRIKVNMMRMKEGDVCQTPLFLPPPCLSTDSTQLTTIQPKTGKAPSCRQKRR